MISVVSELCGIKLLLICCCSSTDYENETFLNTMWCMRTSSHQMLEGVTISVAIGKGLNPAPLLKMTVFTSMVKKIKKVI